MSKDFFNSLRIIPDRRIQPTNSTMAASLLLLLLLSLDRYHFGSTLRYNREAFYFILFFFFLFNIVFSGEKNGWKPLSAIVGIWRDSRTPSEGEDSPVSRTVTGKNSRQVRFAVWKWKNNGVGQTLVFPCKLFTILPISMVQTFGHRLAGGKEIVLLFRDNSLLGELDREGNRGRKRRIEKNVLPVGMKENSRLRYLRDCTRLVGLEIKKTEGRKGPVITFPSS